MLAWKDQWLWISAAAVAVVVAWIGHALLKRVLRKQTEEALETVFESAIKHMLKPLVGMIGLVALRTLMPLSNLSLSYQETITHVFALCWIGLTCWLIMKGTHVLKDYVAFRFAIDVEDNLKARKVHTQLNVIQQIVMVIVLVLGMGIALMTFNSGKQLGQTVLASAGIIGLVVGMAAQKTIGTLIAGLQIAFTQPIRIDDVVIVENEWGRIEEITLTYVVVRIWDQRRLIVPVTYFIEKPFQNWTRISADILGTVFLYVDYTIPVEAIRAQLQTILNESPHWDRKVCVLQVTNTSDKTVELRALMSAEDASEAWTLRCEVREKLIHFVRETYPEALPRVRAELDRES